MAPATPGSDARRSVLAPTGVPRGPGPVGPPPQRVSVRVIEPPAPGLRRYFAEVWRQRAAFGYFVTRFVQKRISRTFLGCLWLFLPVLLPLFMGALVFGGILDVSSRASRTSSTSSSR